MNNVGSAREGSWLVSSLLDGRADVHLEDSMAKVPTNVQQCHV